MRIFDVFFSEYIFIPIIESARIPDFLVAYKSRWFSYAHDLQFKFLRVYSPKVLEEQRQPWLLHQTPGRKFAIASWFCVCETSGSTSQAIVKYAQVM